jgi:hypothetical protein
MILFSVFLIWLLIAYGILRLQRSTKADVELEEGADFIVRWYYKIPISMFHLLALVFVVSATYYLVSESYFDLLFYQGLEIYVESVLSVGEGMSISEGLRISYYIALFFLLTIVCNLVIYSLRSIIKKFFPRYYVYNLKKSEADNLHKRPLSTKYRIVSLLLLGVIAYYSIVYSFVIILMVVPLILLLLGVKMYILFLGLKGEKESLNARMLKAAF